MNQKLVFDIHPEGWTREEFTSFLKEVVEGLDEGRVHRYRVHVLMTAIEDLYKRKRGGTTSISFLVWRHLVEGDTRTHHEKTRHTNFWLVAKRKVLNDLLGSAKPKTGPASEFIRCWHELLLMSDEQFAATVADLDTPTPEK